MISRIIMHEGCCDSETVGLLNEDRPLPRWMNASNTRTVSTKRYEGYRRNKPVHGWSKRKKARLRKGY